MVITALIFSLAITRFIQYVSKSTIKLAIISNQIPDLDKKIKTVNEIANIMPEKDGIITYKTLVDVTGDKLTESVSKIKQGLNHE
ncbi:hypothetical protein [Aquimarina hainanensis]